MKFLQVTDIHLDPYYSPSSNTNPYCHIIDSQPALDHQNRYGNPGSDCDSPRTLLQGTFNYLKNLVLDDEIDLIFWTGDSGRHDRDPTLPHPPSELENQISQVVDLFTESFDILVMPTIGNWDTISKNNANTTDYQQLYNLYAKLWPSAIKKQIKNTFLFGGYFKYHFRNVTIISLNTLTWFTDSNDQDCQISSSNPADIQIKWLELTLATLALKQQQAIIIGHIPPIKETGEPFYKIQCYQQYTQLISTYSSVIISGYYGHTNKDLVYLQTNDQVLLPVTENSMFDKDLVTTSFSNVFFVGPSIVPHYTTGFRTGMVESLNNYWYLKSHVQYSLNITYLNENQNNHVEFEFQRGCETDGWNLVDLKPNSWTSFFQQVQSNESLGIEYGECSTAHFLGRQSRKLNSRKLSRHTRIVGLGSKLTLAKMGEPKFQLTDHLTIMMIVCIMACAVFLRLLPK